MTLQSLLDLAKNSFTSEGAAEFFVQGITNKTRLEIYMDKTPVLQKTINEFQEFLSIKNPDMPVQYLIHKAYFLSYELYVDKRVMIPRFETEDLVMKTADRLRARSSESIAILDVGTGSGAIAIALADLFPRAKVVATDISVGALEVARVNIIKCNFADSIKLLQTDLFSNIHNQQFDLIISNPPYIPEDEIDNLNPTVKNYEPHQALGGGKNGFEIIDRIIKETNEWLSPAGLLALEIDPRQAELIKTKVPWAEFEKDNQGSIRYVFIKYE